jgi:hypothetical protein
MTDMVKRLADWLEKMSVASFAVGLFQAREPNIAVTAIIIGVVAFSSSMALSWYQGRRGK